jgi:5-hydroxyisourate hydrolase-like protein (transthyretin family)
MLYLRYFCVISILFIFSFGCNKNVPPRPEGLPSLYPCKIMVTFGGVPIRGVRVVLVPQTDNERWRPSGLTDSEGNVELSSSYGFDGAPVGVYKVSFSLVQEPDEEEARRGEPIISLIPLKYSQDKTTETIEIKSGKNNFNFQLDAGEEPVPRK